jgi:hypothetical protein
MSPLRLIFIATCSFATAAALHEVRELVEWAKPVTLAIAVPGGHVSAVERSLRPNYPYSVIPGGAYSAEELRNSVGKDKFVRTHYADFDLQSARLVTLAEDRFQYVSYRINNRILWTHKKIRIPKGEVLLTDGRHFARTRCGNRLCAALASPVSFTLAPLKKLVLPPFTMDLLSRSQISLAEPPEVDAGETPGLDLDLPRIAPYLPPAQPMPAATAQNWAPITPMPTLMGAAPGYPLLPSTPAAVVTPTPPVPLSGAPEPPSIYLFMIGFGVSLWFISRWMRSEDRTIQSAN